MSQYPPKDARGETAPALCGARVSGVACGSPADDAGFAPGCLLTSVDGRPLRDVVDWRWLSAGDEIEVAYIDLDGDAGTVELWREPGQDWGFDFDGLVFDGVRQCRNACTFCFMRQLPSGMRPSLYLRDDDFRLSFLAGTFVTLTNIGPEDEARIVEQRISPLRVSLQAADPDARRRLIGRHAAHGIEALDRLLAAGIQFHAQIVLVPGENDGDVLRDTLEWAYARSGILNVGIVPLGYTRHQEWFDRSFDAEEDARALLGLVAPFQERALAERGTPWVFAADEFYRNAWRSDLLAHIPPAAHYGDFSLFEDGIGILRASVDEWDEALRSGAVSRAGAACTAASARIRAIAGFALEGFLDALVGRSRIGGWFEPLFVRNDFFGGNVDVTGLLTGQDIAAAVRADIACGAGRAGGRMCGSARQRDACGRGAAAGMPASPGLRAGDTLYLVPDVVFNDDGLTLDDMTLADMEAASGARLHMVSCSPASYFNEIAGFLKGVG